MSPSMEVVDEFPGFLRVYNDGTVWRSTTPGIDVPVHDDGSVLWKDVIYDTTHNLELRLYKPAISTSKLPILYFIHGGGFVFGLRTWPCHHNYCIKLAFELQVVVIAPDYRLAPENRLPAAFEDGYAALKWLHGQDDEWVMDVADMRRVFVLGDSSGGNIAHHLAVRFGAEAKELSPVVKVRGYVLLAPFFGGNELTNSEAHTPKDAFITLEHLQTFWRLCLPLGGTSDDPLVNPFGPNLEKTVLDPILVVAGESDIVKDRVERYVTRLKLQEKNKIHYVEFKGQQHGFYLFNPDSEPSQHLMLLLNKFIKDNSVWINTT